MVGAVIGSFSGGRTHSCGGMDGGGERRLLLQSGLELVGSQSQLELKVESWVRVRVVWDRASLRRWPFLNLMFIYDPSVNNSRVRPPSACTGNWN